MAPQPATAMVFKQLRHPRPAAELGLLCDLPAVLAVRDEGASRRALSSSAWPAAAVVNDYDAPVALGALMPRAPAEFWLRHRDGPSRLATLSYLAGDPDRMAVAYGVTVPPPGAPERVALVYALARLLDAWQGGGGPIVVHGDLSAKNVLWSLRPAPAVYVLDCDGAVIEGPGRAVMEEGPGTPEGPLALTRSCLVRRGRPPPTGTTLPCQRAAGPIEGPTVTYWASLSFASWAPPTFLSRAASERTRRSTSTWNFPGPGASSRTCPVFGTCASVRCRWSTPPIGRRRTNGRPGWRTCSTSSARRGWRPRPAPPRATNGPPGGASPPGRYCFPAARPGRGDGARRRRPARPAPPGRDYVAVDQARPGFIGDRAGGWWLRVLGRRRPHPAPDGSSDGRRPGPPLTAWRCAWCACLAGASTACAGWPASWCLTLLPPAWSFSWWAWP